MKDMTDRETWEKARGERALATSKADDKCWNNHGHNVVMTCQEGVTIWRLFTDGPVFYHSNMFRTIAVPRRPRKADWPELFQFKSCFRQKLEEFLGVEPAR